MVVLKFGGSSVATADRIQKIGVLLKNSYNKPYTVVFSAFGGITNLLISMSEQAAKGESTYREDLELYVHRHAELLNTLFDGQIPKRVQEVVKSNHDTLSNVLQGIFLVRECSARTLDYIMSFGERNSAFVIAEYLRFIGVNAEFLDARDIIKTDKSFGHAQVFIKKTYQKIQKYYQDRPDRIQIVTGFVSSALGGLTTTLGRGGSDYTAALLAAALQASRLEIWTDVDGVLTADPRRVKKAFTIPRLSFSEAMEMSHFGAKVIYPPTIQPILHDNIPLYIKNSFNPEFEGTFIDASVDKESPAVKGISSISDVSLVTLQGTGMFGVPGIAGRLFSALAEKKINIIMITQGSSEHSISFAIKPGEAKLAKQCVEETFLPEIEKKRIDPVKIESDLSIVAIIGENMRYRPGISGRLFSALGQNGINVVAIAQGSSELNISVVIQSKDESKALNIIHEAFFLSDVKTLHLFMAGVGLIGGTLLKQIAQQAGDLVTTQALDIKVIGLANTKKILFNEEGIELEQWMDQLQTSVEPADISNFVEKMISLNLPNSIFVDNTASKAVTSEYDRILNSSISISTPNKIATSSAFSTFEQLKKSAQKNGVFFRYETNVGAGLPVITTLNDLINSGDQIISIEGVFSGSLSYIFNSFGPGIAMSEIIKKARELGLTEPDPRQDLSLMDVKRKLVILGRVAGFEIELDDIAADQLFSEDLMSLPEVDQFMDRLPEVDQPYEEKVKRAHTDNKKLRVIGRVGTLGMDIKLSEIGPDNPFYSLEGSDNMIVFRTQRYQERPLVIRGPGAGAEVTAAGVFAEVISIGNLLGKGIN